MKKEGFRVKVLILALAFVPSLTLFWNIISLLFGDNKFYSVFQFMAGTYFTLFSIFLTKDMEYFNSWWKNNAKFRMWTDKVLHISGVITAWFPRTMFLLVEVFSNNDAKKEIELHKKEAKSQIEHYDNMSVQVRTVLPVGVISLVMLILVSFNVFPDLVLDWIQEVLNSVVSVVGLIFVVMNVKENELECGDDVKGQIYDKKEEEK